jgi:glutamate N-acetyltransferase/amino-acid N-acetyltransferase
MKMMIRGFDVTRRNGGSLAFSGRHPLPFDAKAASTYLRDNREVLLRLRFTSGTCRFYTCDLTTGFVRLNADYTT